MKKILIVGPAWVGDMVMAQTLFQLLKAQNPNVVIHVLAPSSTHPLLEIMPEVRCGIELPLRSGELEWKVRREIGRKLRDEGYEQAIVLPNSWKSALIPWFANIKKRTGYLGECRYGLLNDSRRLNKSLLPRMIDRFAALGYCREFDLPTTLPYPRLSIKKDSIDTIGKKFSVQVEKPVLALCPGAKFGSAKRWPEKYYAQIAKQKQKEGWDVWLLGSASDVDVANNIEQALSFPVMNFVGKTNLEEVMGLLLMTKLVLTNDSGLMHIAAALQKPLVAVYGSTDPGFAPPLGVSQIVTLKLNCSPCRKRECPLGHHHCMEHLYPERVLQAMSRLVS